MIIRIILFCNKNYIIPDRVQLCSIYVCVFCIKMAMQNQDAGRGMNRQWMGAEKYV